MNVEHAAAGFLRHCEEERGLSTNTIAAYRQDLAEFRAYFAAAGLDEVTGDRLVAFARHLGGVRRLAPATVRRRIACLKSMFAWLVRRGRVAANPFAGVEIRIRLPDRLPRCVAPADMAALAAAADRACEHARLATRCLFATGVRVGELTAVRLGDVDADEGSIRVRGKGDRERLVYVADQATRELLRAYVAVRRRSASSREPLLAEGSRPLTPALVRRLLRDLSGRAGLERHVTPHMLRHTAATSLLEAGVDIRFVQRLLGHRSIATTQIYTHISDAALRAALVRADAVRRFLPAPDPVYARTLFPDPSAPSHCSSGA